MLWMWLLVAQARDVTHKARPTAPPEAYYLLVRQAHCPVAVVVGLDGRPLEARARGCSAVLAEAVEEAAMKWRWEPGAQTMERIRVTVRPSSFTPKLGAEGCFVAFVVDGEAPYEVTGEAPSRCTISPSRVPAYDTGARLTSAWCKVHVTVAGGLLTSVDAGACSEGLAGAAVEAVGSWDFGVERDQRWEVLYGVLPETGHDVGHRSGR